MNIIIIGGASAFLAGAPFFVYDRIMNLYKLFREAIDRGKFGYNGLSTQEDGVLKEQKPKRRQAL